MIYFDTAYIAKCYLNEPGSAAVRQLARQNPDLCSCEIARVEFASAVRRYARDTRASTAVIDEIFDDFNTDEAAGVWTFWPADSPLLMETVRQIRTLPVAVPLRAGDAIHLACAKTRGCREIYSNDRHLLAAASHASLRGINIIS